MSGGAGVKPPNFSWFVERKLAAMGYPDEDGNLRYLAAQGIKTLVNLDGSRYYSYAESPAAHGLTVRSIPVRVLHPPSVKEVKEFLGVVDNTEDVSFFAAACICASPRIANPFVGCGRALRIGFWKDGHHASLLPRGKRGLLWRPSNQGGKEEEEESGCSRDIPAGAGC